MGANVLLLATDFDGTIAPIVQDYRVAAMHPAARAFLSSAGVPVAILSGRDVEDVRARLDGVRAIVAGAHGLECEDADGRVLWTSPRAFPEPPAELLAALERKFRVERKKYAIAVHFRGTTSDGIEPFLAWSREQELDVFDGRMIAEARVPGGGKGAALQRIAEHVGADRVVFAGDDRTDFEALRFAASRGRAVFVQSAEREAPDVPGLASVATIEELCALFAQEVNG